MADDLKDWSPITSTQPMASDWEPVDMSVKQAVDPGVNLKDALKYGLNNTSGLQVLRGLERITGNKIIPSDLKPKEGYEPSGVVENAISIGTSVAADPITYVTGGVTKLLPALAKPGLSVAKMALKGAVEGGSIGLAQSAASQFAEGKLDPTQMAAQTAFGAAAGGALGAAAKTWFSKPNKALAQEMLEGKTLVPGEQAFVSHANFSEWKKLPDQIQVTENKIARALSDSKDTFLSQQARDHAETAIPYFQGELEKLRLRRLELNGDDAVKYYLANQSKLEGVTVKTPDGKIKPAADFLVTPRNTTITPEEILYAKGMKDVSIFQSGALATKDPDRLLSSAGDGLRGTMRKATIEPIQEADRLKRIEETEFRNKFANAVKVLPDKSPERLATLFRYGEKRATAEEINSLSQVEKNFIEQTKTSYRELLTRINEGRARYGLNPIRPRADYLTHQRKLSFLSDLGLDPENATFKDYIRAAREKLVGGTAKETPTIPKVSEPGFRFGKTRTGSSNFVEDPIKAMEAYIGPAFRQIHMLPAGSEAMARISVMPPNLRKAMTEWVASRVYGGVDAGDAALLSTGGGQLAMRIAEPLSKSLTMGAILGNLRILIQQPSQIINTAILTDMPAMVKGMFKAMSYDGDQLAQKSWFQASRSLFSEMPKLESSAWQNFQKFAGALHEKSDKYFARATWLAGIDYGKRVLNLSDDAAIKYADRVASSLHAIYAPLMKPSILAGRKGTAFLPFQSFAFNLWNTLTQDTKLYAQLKGTTQGAMALRMLGGIAATDFLYESMGLPGPFGALKSKGTSLVPIVSGVKYGLPSPALEIPFRETKGVLGIAGGDTEALRKSAIGNLWRFAFAESEDSRHDAAVNALRLVGSHVPWGAQIFNTLKGISDVQKGYSKVAGKEVPLRDSDVPIAVFLGSSATPSVRKFRDEQLKKTRTAMYK